MWDKFHGRANRIGYFTGWLKVIGIGFGAVFLASMVESALGEIGKITPLLGLLVLLFLLFEGIVLAVRRLHDMDRRGDWALLALLPGIGLIFLAALLFMPGTEGPNRFGPDPLAPVPTPTAPNF